MGKASQFYFTRHTMRLSVIIPTRNRARSLKKLLPSLDAVEYPDSVLVECLIVNNCSSDGTGELLATEKSESRKFSFQVLDEQRKGKASALNLALASVKGAVLLIVDDDVIVHPQLFRRHLECYDRMNFDAVQGRILPGIDPEGKAADLERLREYNIPYIDYGDEFREIRGLTCGR